MKFSEQWEKKDKNILLDQLSELPKDTYDSFGSSPDRHILENTYDMKIDQIVFEFNEKLSSNYTMKVIPEGFTHKTLELEGQFTEAANRGDIKAFRELLQAWREAWLSLMVKKAVVIH